MLIDSDLRKTRIIGSFISGFVYSNPKYSMRANFSLRTGGFLARLLVLILSALVSQAATPAEIDALANKATVAYNGKQYAASLRFADEALRLDPKHETALLERGRSLRELGRLGEAMTHLQAAISKQPKSAKLYNALGISYRRGKQSERASHYFATATKFTPRYLEAQNNLTLCFLDMGQYERAEIEARKAVQIDVSSASAHRNLGSALLGRNQFGPALAELEQSLRLEPGDGVTQQRVEEARQKLAASGGGRPTTSTQARSSSTSAQANNPVVTSTVSKQPATPAPAVPAGTTRPSGFEGDWVSKTGQTLSFVKGRSFLNFRIGSFAYLLDTRETRAEGDATVLKVVVAKVQLDFPSDYPAVLQEADRTTARNYTSQLLNLKISKTANGALMFAWQRPGMNGFTQPERFTRQN